MIKKLLLLILVLFTFSTFTVFADEVEEIPTEEAEKNKDLGFFENVFVGFFDFVTSEELTKLATSLSALLLAIYPFIKKYLSAKAQARYNAVTYDLMNWKEQADKYKELTREYARIADTALKQVEAIKDSLILGFDKSNLRQDVKEKIIATLNSVPKLEWTTLDKEPVLEHESTINNEEKDNLLTETIEDTNTGW